MNWLLSLFFSFIGFFVLVHSLPTVEFLQNEPSNALENQTVEGRAAAVVKPVVKPAVQSAVKPALLSTLLTGEPPKAKRTKDNSVKIVGGQPAIPYTYTSIALLKQNGRSACGSTIIAPQWLLTAAHCVYEDLNPTKYTVTAGEHLISKKEGYEQMRNVAQIITHEQYNYKQDRNDIALLRVAEPFHYNIKVKAAVLPSRGFQPKGNVIVAGWGALKQRAHTGSDALMEVELPLIDDATCQQKYRRYKILPSNMCTLKEGGGIDACQGDSGGPVYLGRTEQILVGVASWGEGCAQKDKPGVFTEVSHYLDWIQRHTGVNG